MINLGTRNAAFYELYNIRIDGESFFDQPIENHMKTYEIIRRIANGQ